MNSVFYIGFVVTFCDDDDDVDDDDNNVGNNYDDIGFFFYSYDLNHEAWVTVT